MPLNRYSSYTTRKPGPRSRTPLSKALREDRIVGLANHTRLTSRDGRHIPIDDSAAPIRDDGGKIIGVVLVFRDVTERAAAELAEKQAALVAARHAELLERTNSRTAAIRLRRLARPARAASNDQRLLGTAEAGERHAS